jgi:dihydrofolate synthase/folylpolyglutamate synthase
MPGRAFSSSDEIFDYLMRFVNVERGQATELKLDRMRHLCALLGDPQKAYRTIHVAGSKGKGSVSTMIARILQAAGLKTGLYTSPHLFRWKERTSMAGDEMPEETLLAAMDELYPLIDGKGAADFRGNELPTYFELGTLVAFCAFRLAGCEIAVIETGLGGRLDSTNVVDSEASVITPIELEHTEWLGDSIAKIAFEKAGIIKPGRPCFLSRQVPEAREVFARVCAERGSPLHEMDEFVSLGEPRLDRSGTSVRMSFDPAWPHSERFAEAAAALRVAGSVSLELRSPILGRIQAQNMALALLAAAEVEPRVDRAAVEAGLAAASLPARFEILKLDPPVVLDGAHTPASIRLTLETFEALFPGPKDLLFACAQDKKHAEMAAILAPHFASVTVTRPGSFKQSEPRAVFESFAAYVIGCRLVPEHGQAIASARENAAAAGRPLLVTGSFYLCALAATALAAVQR